LLAVTVVLVSGALLGLAIGLRNPLFVVVEAPVIASFAAMHRWVLPYVERLHRGAKGEEDVGAIVDGLADHGWLPIHDVFIHRGNIDHIVVGPGGIFTIETKSHRGPIRVDKIGSKHLKQAYAEAKLVERVSGFKVEPLLVYSRAYLIGRVPCMREGVLVLPARMLAGFFIRRGGSIPAKRVATVHRELLAKSAAKPD
jgi:Nuclease-related domain